MYKTWGHKANFLIYLKIEYSLPVIIFFCSLPVLHSHLTKIYLYFSKMLAKWEDTVSQVVGDNHYNVNVNIMLK